MKYERIINKNEYEDIINTYKINNFKDLNTIEYLFSNLNMREGRNLLIKHFDYYCKDRILDYMNTNEEAYLKRNVYKCFELATPQFYNSYQQLRKTISDIRTAEETFINECVVFENKKEEIMDCLTNKLKNYKKLLKYDLYVYQREMEEFRKNLYL